MGRQVAFIGIDSRDINAAADALPAPLPGQLSQLRGSIPEHRSVLQTVGVVPQTVYINAQGKQVFDHAGPYETAASLEADIRRYALQ